MTCGILLGKSIPRHTVPGPDLFGASIAEYKLVEATTLEEPSLRWDVWTVSPKSPIAGTGINSALMPDLAGMRRRCGDRFAAQPLHNFSSATKASDYVFISSVPGMPRIDELRQLSGRPGMPICALLHSAMVSDFIPNYLWLAISTTPVDILVSSSTAGRDALTKIIEAARIRIAASTGTHIKTSPPEIVQIPFGVDVPEANAINMAAARHMLSLPRDSFVALYLGRITDRYKADLDPLISAVAGIARSGRDIKLLLAGPVQDRSYVNQIRSRASLLGASEQVIVLESVPEFLKSSLFAACNVFVSPADSIQETFGLTILEAMAHARPVIASSWSGYRDLIVDGETGFLLNTCWSYPALKEATELSVLTGAQEVSHYLSQRTAVDAKELCFKLALLAESSDLARSMGERGRKRVEQTFAWPTIARQFVALWTHQIDLSRKLTLDQNHSRPFANLATFFGHYANNICSPEDTLVTMPQYEAVVSQLASHWQFFDEASYERIIDLIELCSKRPFTVAELIEAGFTYDQILWVAKKSLCSYSSVRRDD